MNNQERKIMRAFGFVIAAALVLLLFICAGLRLADGNGPAAFINLFAGIVVALAWLNFISIFQDV
jgi:hypothetical protein